MHTALPRLLVAILAFGSLLTPTDGHSASLTDCPGIALQVTLGSASDRVLICKGASRAVAFFGLHDLGILEKIQVRLTADDEIMKRGTHIGLYDAQTGVIQFLGFQQALRQCAERSPFGTPMDEALYTSFATHEVAHAIAEQNFEIEPKSRIAHEYIAYVAQISTMQPEKREAVLQNYRVEAFENPAQMSLIYYGLDPSAFAVKAYRHFQGLPDQTGFLQALLSGAIRPGTPPNGW